MRAASRLSAAAALAGGRAFPVRRMQLAIPRVRGAAHAHANASAASQGAAAAASADAPALTWAGLHLRPASEAKAVAAATLRLDDLATSSAEAVASAFRQYGFVWVRDYFSTDDVARLSDISLQVEQAARELLARAKKTGTPLRQIFMEEAMTPIVVPEAKMPSVACRAEDMLTCFPDLLRFVEESVLPAALVATGEPHTPFKDKINFKWPGGGAFTPHQDFPAYSFLGPREHCTAMLSIDASTPEKGCLQVATNWKQIKEELKQSSPEMFVGEHPVLPMVEGGPAHGSIRPEFTERCEWLSLTTTPRDLVLFDSFVPHLSEPNRSTESRRSMFITLNRLREGEHRKAYYNTKRTDPENPMFHIGTPTKARSK